MPKGIRNPQYIKPKEAATIAVIMCGLFIFIRANINKKARRRPPKRTALVSPGSGTKSGGWIHVYPASEKNSGSGYTCIRRRKKILGADIRVSGAGKKIWERIFVYPAPEKKIWERIHVYPAPEKKSESGYTCIQGKK
jgi:hypothetical protein